MNEELDDQLKSRITELFDNYEDDSATEGWLLLREKYPEEGKRRPVMWLWWGSIAAGLLLFLGLGIWLSNKTGVTKKTEMAVNTSTRKHIDPTPYPRESTTITANSTIKSAINTDHDTVGSNPVKGIDRHGLAKTTAQSTLNQAQTKIAFNKNNIGLQPSEVGKTGILQANGKLAQPDHPNKGNQPAGEQPAQAVLADNVQADSSLTRRTYAFVKADSPKVIKSTVKEPAKSIFAMQKGEEPQMKKPAADKRVKFGLYAATYFNYAKGSDNEFNVGAGMSSEFRIIGNLKLLTGLAITQNSLNYKSALPQTANSYLMASLAQPKGGNYLSSAAVAPPTGGIVATTQSTSPVLRNYQASLVGLDIPINLKYQFGKNDTYVSAGVSSGTFLNETYQFIYNYPALSSATALSAPLPQNTKTENMLNTFDFARTLNVAFGIGYPLGKTNRLIIEPFLKYPIDGLGSQQLKFGAGGVNLKLNLQSNKK